MYEPSSWKPSSRSASRVWGLRLRRGRSARAPGRGIVDTRRSSNVLPFRREPPAHRDSRGVEACEYDPRSHRHPCSNDRLPWRIRRRAAGRPLDARIGRHVTNPSLLHLTARRAGAYSRRCARHGRASRRWATLRWRSAGRGRIREESERCAVGAPLSAAAQGPSVASPARGPSRTGRA